MRRDFASPAGLVGREVPGSFYEFISRDTLASDTADTASQAAPRLDLAFDAGNAAGIFGMTAAAA